MKCKIPEISWHNRDPVLSVDIQLKNSGLQAPTLWRLASGGTDAHVLIWYVNKGDNGEGVDLELAADLARHQRAVNTVRWSPNGELLASGDDESVVFIWKQKAENEVVNIVDADSMSEQDKEVWITLKVLRGHREDIYDLSWSPNSQYLVTGSVDNTAMMWDVHKGKSLAILDDHKGYVQGVAWDPCNQLIATMSTDRHLRIFDAQTKRVLHRVSKSVLPVNEDSELYDKSIRLFHDGTLQTFFRRLCFTPDGNLLLTPSGITDYDGVIKPTNTTYGFSRYDLDTPAFVLPFANEYTVAVRCSPILYRLRPYKAEENPPLVDLPYRMIYAVATKNSVLFYDTQQAVPFAIVSNIHYTRLTDVAWSGDGNFLVVSSTDGFCSLLTFDADELGERYEEMDAVLSAVSKTNDIEPSTIKKTKKLRLRKSLDARKSLRENQKLNGMPLKRKREAEEDSSDSKENGITDLDAENDSSTHSSLTSTSSSPNQRQGIDADPTPIAIRRSPRKVSDTAVEASNTPKFIEIRRQPRAKIIETATNVSNKDTVPTAAKRQKTETLQMKPLETVTLLSRPVEIVMAKEIIRSDEKFESPEKKSRPVTPIQVRRQPRTPGSNTQTPKLQPAKNATPIAIRRTPRVLIEMPVNSPVVVEEAMDAWPIPLSDTQKSKSPAKKVSKPSKLQLTLNEATNDRTEDMRLVYEDTQDDSTPAASLEEEPLTNANIVVSAKPSTPTSKTPRRVSLRTISTPKSKKKLLE